MKTRSVLTFLILALTGATSHAAEPLREFRAEEANQGVAVDAAHVYAIDNRRIGKYDKFTGERVAVWEADEARPLIHLNSAIVREGKLIAAHSNYSGLPMTGSVEIWDTATLEHVGSHSFGVYEGSLTWFDWHGGAWWGCFAHYAGGGGYPDKGPAYTTVVKFDGEFRPLASWVLPATVLERMAPYSASGGAWGPDGRLYLSGHDLPELYIVELPRAGSTLTHVGTVPFPNAGQAIAFDRTGTGLLYGIVRKTRSIVAAPAPAAE